MEESKKPEGRRRQNFLVVRRVARAFRLAVEHRDLIWLSRVFTWYHMLGVCCYDLVRRFRNRLCTARWLIWCWVQSQWGRVLCSRRVAYGYVSNRARPRCGVWCYTPRPRCEDLKGLAVGSLEMVWIWFGMEMCWKDSRVFKLCLSSPPFSKFFYCLILVTL